MGVVLIKWAWPKKFRALRAHYYYSPTILKILDLPLKSALGHAHKLDCSRYLPQPTASALIIALKI